MNERIKEALENLLSSIYNEQNIQDGHITPYQNLRFDGIISDCTELFVELIKQNKED